MAADFVKALYQQGLIDDEWARHQTPADELRARLRAAAGRMGVQFHSGSSSKDIASYRRMIPGGKDLPLHRLIRMVGHEGRLNVIAPTDIIAAKQAGILFGDQAQGVSLQSTRLQNIAAVMQGHELSEAFEYGKARKAGVRNPQFGSHVSPQVIHNEMQLATKLGSQTLQDVISFRKWEMGILRGLEGSPQELARHAPYIKKIEDILTQYEPQARALRGAEYVAKMQRVAEPGVFHLPEASQVGAAEIGRGIRAGDEGWFNFLDEQKKKSGAVTSAKRVAEQVVAPSPKMAMWKKLALGAGALYGIYKIAGFDDHYNTIPGLDHRGLAQEQRKVLTEFGSGYDRVRAMARGAGEAFEAFTKKKGFQEALENAQYVKKLGEGAFGSAHLMKARIGEEEFQFVRKTVSPTNLIDEGTIRAVEQGRLSKSFVEEKILQGKFSFDEVKNALDLRHEGSMLQPFGTTEFAPSIYSSGKHSLDMEFMPGKRLDLLSMSDDMSRWTEKTADRYREAVETVRKAGVVNRDLHTGNLMYDPDTDRISWIDFGLAAKSRDPQQVFIMKQKLEGSLGYMENTLAYRRKQAAWEQQQALLPQGVKTAGPQKPLAEGDWFDTPMPSASGTARNMAASGMSHSGMSTMKRNLTSDFGSPWKGFFGGISRKVMKSLGKRPGVSAQLLDPRKAAKAAAGSSLEEFASSIGVKNLHIARSAQQQESLLARLQQAGITPEAHRKAGGAYAFRLGDQHHVVMDVEALRTAATKRLARRKKLTPEAKQALQSEDFLKTILYHESLEAQSAAIYGGSALLSKASGAHHSGQVLLGEAGFVQATKNQALMSVFKGIRSKGVERKLYSAGLEAFGKNGKSAELRGLITDFGSGYQGLVYSKSRQLATSFSGPGRVSAKLAESAKDLAVAQKQIWTWGRDGGKGHTGYAGEAVKQLSRHGGS